MLQEPWIQKPRPYEAGRATGTGDSNAHFRKTLLKSKRESTREALRADLKFFRLSVMKAPAEFRVNLTWIVVVEAAKSQAIVDQQVAVGNV